MSKKIEIGLRLQSLRDRLGLRQNELAKQVNWSAARLSRVESGERPLSDDELQVLSEAIGTDEAKDLPEVANREWAILTRPAIGHPDENLLWETEQALKNLQELSETDGVKTPFVRRIEEFQNELTRNAERILSLQHNVAFVGTIGVGKSSAICRVTGLEIDVESSPSPSTVLEVGAGGVTICDVRIRRGPGYGFIVEPKGNEEILLDVGNFAEGIMRRNDEPSPEQADSDWVGVSKEVSRAIRNMTGLTSVRERDAEGKSIRIDPMNDLAEKYADPAQFSVELLARMNLHSRNRRDIWYPFGDSLSEERESLDGDALIWLKETFESINNGRHSEFSLPNRIEVVVPQAILGNADLSICLVDTKGIDQTAEQNGRSDLESHLRDDRTVTVLCSHFYDAPAVAAMSLLERVYEGGLRDIANRASMLVLPRPEEALAQKDDQGYPAETASEGYELKSEQVEDELNKLSLKLNTHFFNAREDDRSDLLEFLVARVQDLRDSYRNDLRSAINGSVDLVRNFEQVQVHEIQRQATSNLKTWLDNHSDITVINPFLKESLMQSLRSSAAATVSASVRRNGRWHNLEFPHQLGHGARRTAVRSVETKFNDFRGIAQNLLENEELSDAHPLVEQSLRIMDNGIDEILKKVELSGRSVHEDGMRHDRDFWAKCVSEWGTGVPGYKGRVENHNQNWFDDPSHDIYHKQIDALIKSEWKVAVDRVESLLDIDDQT